MYVHGTLIHFAKQEGTIMTIHVTSISQINIRREREKKKGKYLRTSGAIRPDLSTKCVVSQVLTFSKSKIIPSIVFFRYTVFETKNDDNNNIGIK